MKRLSILIVLLMLLTASVLSARSVLPVHMWYAYDAVSGKLIKSGGIFDQREATRLAIIGPGSTLKPFLLAAAIEGGLDPHKTVFCPPKKIETPADKRCWLAAGHGAVDLVRGLANSCSVYTRHACRYVDADRYRDLLTAYGLGARLPDEPTFRKLGCEAWMGAERGIAVTPQELALAYRLAFAPKRPDDAPPELAGLDVIKQGLRESCLTGTGRDVRLFAPMLEAMGKTGTGHTLDGRRCGIFVALAPADEPKLVLVLVASRASGSQAANLAGQRLSELLNLTAP